MVNTTTTTRTTTKTHSKPRGKNRYERRMKIPRITLTIEQEDTSPPSTFSFPSPPLHLSFPSPPVQPSTKRRGRDPGPGKRLRETPEYTELREKWEELMESDGRGSKNSRMFVFQGLMREWGDLLTKYGYGHEHEYTKVRV